MAHCLYRFLKPFVKIFQGQVADQYAKTYVCGLLSNLARQNVESIAYRLGPSRLPLQAFIGWDEWDDEPLRLEVRQQVKTSLGQGDGVLVFDPAGCPKSGRQSVGVARQWCGRLGKVDNCQVALYLGYVSRKGSTLVEQRLFLPTDWSKEKTRRDMVLPSSDIPKSDDTTLAYGQQRTRARPSMFRESGGRISCPLMSLTSRETYSLDQEPVLVQDHLQRAIFQAPLTCCRTSCCAPT